MRIIDNNKDFYDYCQSIYPDNTFTFDRRDSYNFSREEFASHFKKERPRSRYWDSRRNGIYHILLQVCHTFWLFKLTVLTTDDYEICLSYNIELLSSWKNFNSKRELLKLSTIRPNIPYSFYFEKSSTDEKYLTAIIDAINRNDYKTEKVFNSFKLIKSAKDFASGIEEKHIPILKNIGIASLINPQDIYFALEEYFSMEKTDSERTEAVGTTNNDKIIMHGFDLKTSFRGKN